MIPAWLTVRDRRIVAPKGEAVGLRQADYRGILSFLGDLGTANDLDGFMTTSVGRLHDLVPAQWISFHDLTYTYPRPFHPEVIDVFAYYEEPPVSEVPDAADIQSSCEHANPLCATHDGLPHVRRISDVIDRTAVLARHDFYQELMYPIGREFEAKATLPSQPGLCRAFVLSRDGHDFSDRETLVIEALLPHLAHGFRNARDREVTSALAATLEEAAGFRGMGIVVLGPSERIEAFAGRGQELLESYVGRENGHLPDPLASWTREQHRRMASPEIGLPAEPFVVETPGGHLTIRLVTAGRRPRLLLEDHGIPAFEPDPDYGLTRREVDILRLVGRGLTNKQAARLLDVRPSTVRKHLENAYAKLGVGTRTAAIARAFPR
jgi:DNA-binding CsgD family transcriptional regulator